MLPPLEEGRGRARRASLPAQLRRPSIHDASPSTELVERVIETNVRLGEEGPAQVPPPAAMRRRRTTISIGSAAEAAAALAAADKCQWSAEHVDHPADERDLFPFEDRSADGTRVIISDWQRLGRREPEERIRERRRSLGGRPVVATAIAAFWRTAGLGPDERMSAHQYVEIYARVAQALGAAGTGPWASTRARTLARNDWARDMRGRPSAEGMPLDAFSAGMLELADLWTDHEDEDAYAAFLATLHRRVTALKAPADARLSALLAPTQHTGAGDPAEDDVRRTAPVAAPAHAPAAASLSPGRRRGSLGRPRAAADGERSRRSSATETARALAAAPRALRPLADVRPLMHLHIVCAAQPVAGSGGGPIELAPTDVAVEVRASSLEQAGGRWLASSRAAPTWVRRDAQDVAGSASERDATLAALAEAVSRSEAAMGEAGAAARAAETLRACIAACIKAGLGSRGQVADAYDVLARTLAAEELAAAERAHAHAAHAGDDGARAAAAHGVRRARALHSELRAAGLVHSRALGQPTQTAPAFRGGTEDGGAGSSRLPADRALAPPDPHAASRDAGGPLMPSSAARPRSPAALRPSRRSLPAILPSVRAPTPPADARRTRLSLSPVCGVRRRVESPPTASSIQLPRVPGSSAVRAGSHASPADGRAPAFDERRAAEVALSDESSSAGSFSEAVHCRYRVSLAGLPRVALSRAPR